jgi:hypothetical protein
MDAQSSLFRFDGASTLELVLAGDDGAPWVVGFSAGMERFIGAYPRIDGFGAGGPLLVFRPAGQPA